MGKALIVTSGKGGTGKTTAAAAIASALAREKHKVLCLDADVVLRNLDLSLGVSDLAVMSFFDVIDGRCKLSRAVVEHPQISGLHFLTAPVNTSFDSLSIPAFQSLIEEIKGAYDYCIIDCPAGLGSGFEFTAACADLALVVSTADDSSCRDAQRTAAELLSRGVEDIRLIVNRVRPRLFRKVSLNVDDIVDKVGARLIGIVPEDERVTIAANSGKALLEYSSKGATKAFANIAKRIDGQSVSLMRI